MPEDQGINGDLWNDEASRLLKKLGWTQIGDSNLDLQNSDLLPVGVDRIFTFLDGRRSRTLAQCCLVEAKCYNTASISKGEFQKWILRLNEKIAKTRDSEAVYQMFPILRDTIISSGLIVIWFSNSEEYGQFRESFQQMKKGVSIPRRSSKISNQIYVIDNFDILRLASMSTSIDQFNTTNKSNLKFYYPPSDTNTGIASRTNQITLDYIFSKIVLMEAFVDDVEHKVVFYFGRLNIDSFKRLYSFLNRVLFIDKDKPLHIYTYERDSEFRKTKPEAQRNFDGTNCKFHEMDRFSDIPAFLKNNS